MCRSCDDGNSGIYFNLTDAKNHGQRRADMREDMKKWLLGVPLVLIAVFIWMPLWMLISGTFMGGAELSENLAPVLEGRGGTACMACNCALSDTGGICGTIIGYAPVFYGILEFLQAGFSDHTRSCPFGRSCGMGIC